ncbi:Hypothetical predicted protein [Octopus vulgaris]|uniref:Uncharacterized protein n=1 Tax=Octopus vulgaris TaxID=6645 RepID=A0AA36AZJ4_OCTVU|nr:Hypothetical predicted protein [Octopus vulgaris]
MVVAVVTAVVAAMLPLLFHKSVEEQALVEQGTASGCNSDCGYDNFIIMVVMCSCEVVFDNCYYDGCGGSYTIDINYDDGYDGGCDDYVSCWTFVIIVVVMILGKTIVISGCGFGGNYNIGYDSVEKIVPKVWL